MDGQRSPMLAVLGALGAAGAFALIAGLLAYSLVAAVRDSAEETPPRAVRAEPTATKVPFVWTGGPYVRPPSALYIFIMCDGETVEGAIYSGPIDSDYVTLRPSREHDLIVDLLEGRETMFPSHARIFQSACAKRLYAGTAQQ